MSIQQPARKRPNPGDSMSTQQSTTDDQPTLARFGTGTSATTDPTPSSSRPDELEADATGPKQTTLAGEWSDAELAALYEDRRLFPAEIAAEIDADLSATQIRDRLRRMGALAVHDDRTALAHLQARGWSTTEIAAEACDGDVSGETIAARLHRFGLATTDTATVLEQTDPEDVSLEAGTPSDDTGASVETCRTALLAAADAHDCAVADLSLPDYEDYAAAVEYAPDVSDVLETMDGWQAAKRAAAAVREGGERR